MRTRRSLALISLGRVLLFCLILAMPRFQAHARIAFMSERDGNWEIYVMDASAGNLRNLTNHPAADGPAAWSPNGVHIAFVSDRDGDNDIYVMDAKGRIVRNLTRSRKFDSAPDWSPDGKRIAFDSNRGDGRHVFVIDADGDRLQNLTINHPFPDLPLDHDLPRHGHDNREPSWSPSGEKIAFESLRDENYEIYVMNADGTNPHRLTDNIAYDSGPAWSPSGQQIAFMSNRDSENPRHIRSFDDGFDIYVMESDGSHPRRLTDEPGWDGSPFWSSDGERIAFSSNRIKKAQFDIYVTDIDGGNLQRLTDDASSNFGQDWVPPGLSVSPAGKQFKMWGRLKGDQNNVAPDAADSTTSN